MKTILILLLSTLMLSAADPKRESGLSVHMLPDRVAKISGEQGGFTVKDPPTTFTEAKDLLVHFQTLSLLVQENGIWVVTTNPSSYSEPEQAKLKTLAVLCVERKIPVYMPSF